MKTLLAGMLALSISAVSAEQPLDQFVVKIDLRESIAPLVGRPISLPEALDEALEQDFDLALARADEQIAREHRYIADAGLYPSLEVGLFARRLNGRVQGSFGFIMDTSYSTYIAGAALVYRANIVGQLKHAFAARQIVEAAQFDRLDTEQRLILRVFELYQDLLLAGVAMEVTHDIVVRSEQFLKVIRARTEGGLSLGADVARAEAKLAVDRQDLIQARNLMVNTGTRLAVVLRRDVDVVLVPTDDHLSPTPLPPPSDPHSPARPDLQAADRRAAAASRLVSSARWDLYFPELRAALGHVQLGDTTDDLEGRDQRAGLLMWDLSPAAFGEIRQRRAEEHRARLQLARLENRAAGEIRRAQEDLEGARGRIPLAEDGFRAANDALRLSEARFKVGTGIALEVLDAQNVLAQARFNFARAIVDYNSAQVRLLAASGTIDRSSLRLGQTP